MLWVMLTRTPSKAPHSGLEAASNDEVLRLCERAIEPLVLTRAAQGAAPACTIASLEPANASGYSAYAQDDAVHPTRIFDYVGCRELDLQPGDALLLLRGTKHRTQDYLAARTAITFDLCPARADGKPAPVGLEHNLEPYDDGACSEDTPWLV